MKYIFDVDGTLTPSRQKLDPNFLIFFNSFALANDVYLVTGSDRDKTIEQITHLSTVIVRGCIIVLEMMCMKEIFQYILILGHYH